jgi:hypothetical protein
MIEEGYEDKWKGGQDGAGLQAFEAAGPREGHGPQGLNDAQSEFGIVPPGILWVF